MNRDNDLNLISFVKVICMIMVVLGHACAVYRGSWCSFSPIVTCPFIGFINEWLSTLHVQTFTFASGYLFYYLRYEKGKYRNIRDIKKRARRLLLPYAVWSLWAFAFDCYFQKYALKDVLRYYVLAISPAQLWFLVMLFWIFVVFYFAGDIIYSNKKSILRVFIFFVFVLIFYLEKVLGKWLPLGVFQIGNTMKYLLFYYVGGIVRKNIQLFDNKKICGILVANEVLIVIPYIYCVYFYPFVVPTLFINLFEPLISIYGILFVYSLSKIICSKRILESKIYVLLLDNSMGIYVVHQQLMFIFLSILLQEKIQPILITTVVFICGLLCSLVFIYLLRKFKIGRFLLGES